MINALTVFSNWKNFETYTKLHGGPNGGTSSAYKFTFANNLFTLTHGDFVRYNIDGEFTPCFYDVVYIENENVSIKIKFTESYRGYGPTLSDRRFNNVSSIEFGVFTWGVNNTKGGYLDGSECYVDIMSVNIRRKHRKVTREQIDEFITILLMAQ